MGYLVQGGAKFAGYEFWKKQFTQIAGDQETAVKYRTAIYLGASSVGECVFYCMLPSFRYSQILSQVLRRHHAHAARGDTHPTRLAARVRYGTRIRLHAASARRGHAWTVLGFSAHPLQVRIASHTFRVRLVCSQPHRYSSCHCCIRELHCVREHERGCDCAGHDHDLSCEHRDKRAKYDTLHGYESQYEYEHKHEHEHSADLPPTLANILSFHDDAFLLLDCSVSAGRQIPYAIGQFTVNELCHEIAFRSMTEEQRAALSGASKFSVDLGSGIIAGFAAAILSQVQSSPPSVHV